jgi:hypothetical protein
VSEGRDDKSKQARTNATDYTQHEFVGEGRDDKSKQARTNATDYTQHEFVGEGRDDDIVLYCIVLYCIAPPQTTADHRIPPLGLVWINVATTDTAADATVIVTEADSATATTKERAHYWGQLHAHRRMRTSSNTQHECNRPRIVVTARRVNYS